jgi:hypothetical protein
LLSDIYENAANLDVRNAAKRKLGK